MSKNLLYYGDNLDILRRYIKDESADLIYLDPPFKSNQDYNVLFAEKNGSNSKSQIKAFEDTWIWDEAAVESYAEMVECGPDKVSQALQGFRRFLGPSDMLAYLSMMAPRLVELNRVLKPTGTIYLHCDPTASHYLKMLMDAIFGGSHFQNEIVWYYRRYTAASNRLQRLHDIIFWYTKTSKWTFNEQREPYAETSGKKDSHYKQDEQGLWFRWQKRMGKKPYKVYLDERGKRVGDVWPLQHINASAKERLGYPTQKPEALLERIIVSSSNEGDVVLDPFCGCGTTVSVAERLNRQWMGIDITYLAIALIKHRLTSAYEGKEQYKVVGEPVSIPDAEALAKQDPYQFQWWALGLVGARPAEQKKGADKGIDGRLYFHDESEDAETKQIIFSVKAGNVTVSQVRDLRGVIERENAAIGVFITFNEPTKPMRKEAAEAGLYHSPGWKKKYPRLQLVTVAELLSGKGIKCPPSKHVNMTFKKAPKAKRKKDHTKHLPLF